MSDLASYELTYAALYAADWWQTIQIAKNPERYGERNPVLGEHPSVEKVNLYFAASALATKYIVSNVFDEKHQRLAWTILILNRANVVSINYSLGIK